MPTLQTCLLSKINAMENRNASTGQMRWEIVGTVLQHCYHILAVAIHQKQAIIALKWRAIQVSRFSIEFSDGFAVVFTSVCYQK